jgi:hypothetical protein
MQDEQNTNTSGSKGNAPRVTEYYAIIKSVTEEIGYSMNDGILTHPDRTKTDGNDFVSDVGSWMLKRQMPPIADNYIKKYYFEYCDNLKNNEIRKLRTSIAYDANAPDRWKELMSIVFLQNDDVDELVLRHMVWLIKRRIMRLPVGQEHRPLMLNICGMRGMGKSLFVSKYLLSPLPAAKVCEIADLGQVINDERNYHLLGDCFALVFGEKGNAGKVNINKLKMLVDAPVLNYRCLGLNIHNKVANAATLFSTSNSPLRDDLKDESPRKWYEIEFPVRTKDEIDKYIQQRDSIPIHELWKCVNENVDSPLLEQWNEVQRRIDQRCRYVPDVIKWVYDYMFKSESGEGIVGKNIRVKTLYDLYVSEQTKREFAVSNKTFIDRLESIGFEKRKTMYGTEVSIDQSKFTSAMQDYSQLEGKVNAYAYFTN